MTFFVIKVFIKVDSWITFWSELFIKGIYGQTLSTCNIIAISFRFEPAALLRLQCFFKLWFSLGVIFTVRIRCVLLAAIAYSSASLSWVSQLTISMFARFFIIFIDFLIFNILVYKYLILLCYLLQLIFCKALFQLLREFI